MIFNGVYSQFTQKDFLSGKPMTRAEGASDAVIAAIPGVSLEKAFVKTLEKTLFKSGEKLIEKQVEKAGLDVKIAKKEFLPAFNIMGLLFFSSSALSSSMNWANALALLGGGAMLPIFTGGAKFASLKLNKNKYEQILQNYYKTNLVAIQEVNDSLSSLKLDDEKYHKNLKSYDMQKADFKYMQMRHAQGIMSGLDLLQQKESLLVIDEMVTASKTECYIDQISLYKAVGGKL
jgi:outer membrane protein TolC